jgi:hypothetical protein
VVESASTFHVRVPAPRLTHVAHLTQAVIALQRWNNEFEARGSERGASSFRAKADERGGLSSETSQPLRNALLCIAPFGSEDSEPQKVNPSWSVTVLRPKARQKAEEFYRYENMARAGPGEPGKKLTARTTATSIYQSRRQAIAAITSSALPFVSFSAKYV